MYLINGTTNVTLPVYPEETTVNTGNTANNTNETGTGQNTASDFASVFNESLKEQALQSVMSRMSGAFNSPGDMSGFGGTNAMLGGIGGLSGTNAMLNMTGGLNGIGGIGGFMPSSTAGFENTLVSAAGSGEMSGAQLMLFLMIMMMQSEGGGSGDMAPIMQMLAGMLSQFSDDAASGKKNNMLMLGDMQGDTPGGVKRMVDLALEQVGYHERNSDGSYGSGNISKFGAWYGMDGQPWCAMFVSWAADQAGILNTVVPKHAYTPTGAKAYSERGLYAPRESGYIPREGDAVYFYSKAKGRIGHVGIVVAYDPETQRVYTVEGNTNNAVRIRHYDINNPYIHGYGRNGGNSFGTVPGSSSSGTGASIE